MLAIGAATASAGGERVRVCSDEFVFNDQPGQGRDGVLSKGESFRVRRRSTSGKYAYGLAYGDINRLGWVRASGLRDSGHT